MPSASVVKNCDQRGSLSGAIRQPSVSVFAYGTLKAGFHNHARFIPRGAAVQEASLPGRLYDTGWGFPVLEVPPSLVMAEATGDPAEDAAILGGLKARRPAAEGWPEAHGQLVSHGWPEAWLPGLDRLEGFSPSGRSMYRRVAVPVMAGGRAVPAWAYVMGDREFPRMRLLPAGVWAGPPGYGPGADSLL
jgi:gamma-glutamylcyclotransferase (GGCT)/AIG2-like uncharacterized protein YtfP